MAAGKGSERPAAKAAKAKPVKPAKGAATETERADTEYIVLRRVEVSFPVKLPDGEVEAFGALLEPVRAAVKQGVWVPVMQQGRTAQESGTWVVRKIKAPRGELAIEAVTGKGEGALVGEWKAVSWTSWKGVVRVDPPLPILQDQRAVSLDE